MNPAMFEARKRGVIFDVGHGGGSFVWRIAVPAHAAGLPARFHLHRSAHRQHERRHERHAEPDEQFLAMGCRSTMWWPNPPGTRRARSSMKSSGNLSVGAPADVAVLRLEHGDFGFTDMYGARMSGQPELVVRADAARRQGGLRSERHHAAGLGETRAAIHSTGRPGVGRDDRPRGSRAEVTYCYIFPVGAVRSKQEKWGPSGSVFWGISTRSTVRTTRRTRPCGMRRGRGELR